NVRNDASGTRPTKSQDATHAARECTFAGFMKCNPTSFCDTKGAVELMRWFKKTESVFGTSECAKGKKVRQGNARAMDTAPTDEKVSSGSLPLSERCFTRHFGQCTIKCHKCRKVRHKLTYCKEKNVTINANALPIPTFFDCGEQVNRVFKINLMPIELGKFDVNIGMDWLVKHDAFIIYGEKVVHIPYGNKMLIVESDNGVSRLKVIYCIMANVPLIRDSPKVFPEELPRLPPPRQVEFRINLVPRVVPVACAPYRLASSEMKELLVQLQDLLEKGFIHPCSSPWGAPMLFMKKKDGSFR
nr:putative reverse transcriptase domain-containing protein [Tanacetum cinerariifolium]